MYRQYFLHGRCVDNCYNVVVVVEGCLNAEILCDAGAGSQLSGVEELASYLSDLINSDTAVASEQAKIDCGPYVLSAMALLCNQIWPQHGTIDNLRDATKFFGHSERKLHSPRLGGAIVKGALKDFFGSTRVDFDTLPAALSGPALGSFGACIQCKLLLDNT